MLTLLSFLVALVGCINWLSIGMLQYDFIAGLFGYQASIFSRLIYILIGASSFILVFKAFKDKGKINLINFGFKKKKSEKNIVENEQLSYQNANIESGKDFSEYEKKNIKPSGKDYSENSAKTENIPQNNSIFDEMK